MLDYFKQSLSNQYEAALCMLNRCIAACPVDRWEDKIAQGTFRWVTYHTLFFTDLYLTTSNEDFELRELHERGGDERDPIACPGLSKDESLAYLQLCREKCANLSPPRRKQRSPVLPASSGMKSPAAKCTSSTSATSSTTPAN